MNLKFFPGQPGRVQPVAEGSASHRDLAGTTGTVAAIAPDPESGQWEFGVFIDTLGEVWMLKEGDLVAEDDDFARTHQQASLIVDVHLDHVVEAAAALSHEAVR